MSLDISLISASFSSQCLRLTASPPSHPKWSTGVLDLQTEGERIPYFPFIPTIFPPPLSSLFCSTLCLPHFTQTKQDDKITLLPQVFNGMVSLYMQTCRFTPGKTIHRHSIISWSTFQVEGVFFFPTPKTISSSVCRLYP